MASLLVPLLLLVQSVAAAGQTESDLGRRPHLIAVDVFLSGSETPISAQPLDRLWVDPAAVTRIECRFDRRDGANPLQASASGKSWSFLFHENEPRAVLTVTEEIRDAWIEEGKLSIAAGRDPSVELWWRPRRLPFAAEGSELEVKQRGVASVPGSNGWLEVHLGDITGGRVRLGLRTAEGESLVASRSVAQGDTVPFSLEEETYALQVLLLRNKLIGVDFARLRVIRRDADGSRREPAGAREKSEARLELCAELTRLVEKKLATAAERIRRAGDLLGEGKDAEAQAILEEARLSGEEATRASGFIRTVASERESWAASLSFIKVRPVEQRWVGTRSRGRPAVRAWFSFIRRMAGDETRILETEVLDVRATGNRYRPGTFLGRLHPDRKRTDLLPGARIRLYNDPRRSGIELETGAEYLAFIEPSNPWDGIPGLIGGKGRTYIVFAARDP